MFVCGADMRGVLPPILVELLAQCSEGYESHCTDFKFPHPACLCTHTAAVVIVAIGTTTPLWGMC